jgi:CRISPR/Cas system Type II protein with McrA/HNH and RuvC-like nuclease domain
MDKKHAFKIWDTIFGREEYGKDFAGTPICKNHYNDRQATTLYKHDDGKKTHELNYPTGWNIHHVLPLSKGGADSIENLVIVNIRNHDLIGDKTSFVIDGNECQVLRGKGDRKSHLIKVQSR